MRSGVLARFRPGGDAATARPPGPRGRPLVGALWDYERDPAGYLERCRDTYGDVFALTPQQVVLCRPDWTQQVFAGTNRQFRLRTSGMTRRRSLMTDEVELWMRARSSGLHRLGRDAVEAGLPGIRDRLRAGLETWADRSAPLGVAGCEDLAATAALPVFVADADAELHRLIAVAARSVGPLTESSYTPPPWASGRVRHFRRAVDALVDGLTSVAATRDRSRPPGDPPRDVLDHLLDARSDAGRRAFTDVEVAQVLATTCTNLHAVGGAALAWLLVTAGRPGADRPAGLPERAWADAVVRETLRLHPPIWTTGRYVREPVEFGGRLLPAGTVVPVSPRLLHTAPRWWRDDPAQFRPARWLDPAGPPHQPHAYLPYGSGPRVCVGAQVAQTLLVETYLLLERRWAVAAEPVEPAPHLAAVIVPAELAVRLTPR